MTRRMEPISLAIIGGTGVYTLAQFELVQTHAMQTRYGAPSAAIHVGTMAGQRIAFLARHGHNHGIAPCQINYRANIDALAQLGVTRILALNAVGGITDAFGPRVMACPDQLIDFTWGRISSFCLEPQTPITHVDMTLPYSTSLRHALLAAARSVNVSLHPGGCLGVTQGPRLETSAEIARMRRDGCDLVGMTGMPEAALARERGIAYACLAMVANWAAGCGGTDEITMEEVKMNVQIAARHLPSVIAALAATVGG